MAGRYRGAQAECMHSACLSFKRLVWFRARERQRDCVIRAEWFPQAFGRASFYTNPTHAHTLSHSHSIFLFFFHSLPSSLTFSSLPFLLLFLIFAPLNFSAPKPLRPSSQAQSCFCGGCEKSILFGELSTGAKGFFDCLPPSLASSTPLPLLFRPLAKLRSMEISLGLRSWYAPSHLTLPTCWPQELGEQEKPSREPGQFR